MDTMHEVHKTTRDEYGLKAGGVLVALDNFRTLFGLRLGHLLFGAAEESSKALQAKDTSVQEALASVKLLVSFYKRQRTNSSFESFFAGTEALATELKISPPVLPRYRRQPRRLNDGEEEHRFDTPKAMFRQVYFEACDLLIGEVNDRFNQDFMTPLIAIEDVIVKSAK